MKKLLFIIPALNEEESIATVVEELRRAHPKASLVVINDGSSDHTSQKARDAGALVVDLPFNLGIGSAVQTGFMIAKRGGVDFAVQFDGDHQHCADEVEKLLAPLRSGSANAVIGSRFLGESGYRSPFFRRVGISIFSLVNSVLTRQKLTDSTSGFRAYDRAAIGFLADNYPHDYPEPESIIMLVRHGFRLEEVPVSMRARETGRSSITFLRSIYYAIKVMIAVVIGATRGKESRRA